MIQKVSFNPYAAQSQSAQKQKNVAFGNFANEIAYIDLTSSIIRLGDNLSKPDAKTNECFAQAFTDIAQLFQKNPNFDPREVAIKLKDLAEKYKTL